MVKIISILLDLLNNISKLLYKFSLYLLDFLPNDKSVNSISEPYRKFGIDPLPIVEVENRSIPFLEAVDLYKQKHHGKLPKPIRRHQHKPSNIPNDIKCSHCGATHEYIYDNKSGKNHTQYRCKVCDSTFSYHKDCVSNEIYRCPFCNHKLQPQHTREHFTTYKCFNKHCSFYLNHLNKLSKSEKLRYKSDPSDFKLHYITRVFSASIETLDKLRAISIPSKVNLSNIKSSRNCLGLILTYHINYGLSLRKTALILKEVHDIHLSHQTVANYAEAVARLMDPWLDNYQYPTLSHHQCADETYVKIKGKHAYVFFMSDIYAKIITSYTIFKKRDTFSAIQAFYAVLRKFKDEVPSTLYFVVDGNPIYMAAQQFFHHRNIHFDIHQVIGLSNKDETSRVFRHAKQITERLNRTFNHNYYVKNGFASLQKANEFMCLFTSYFNFLRIHSSLNYRTPVELDELKDITNMPRKWNILINMAVSYHHQKATV